MELNALIRKRNVFLLMILLLISNLSCKKDGIKELNQEDMNRVEAWFTQKTANSKTFLVSSTGDSILVILKPKWSSAVSLTGQQDSFVIPIEVDLPKRLLGKITPAFVIRKERSDYSIHITNTKGLDISQTSSNTSNVNAVINNTVSLNGGVDKNQNPQPKSTSNAINSTLKNTPPAPGSPMGIPQDPIGTEPQCTDWYWVTTYYVDNQPTFTSSEFAFRTCETEASGGHGVGNYGVDSNCQNCIILDSKFEEFLDYALSVGMAVSDPFNATLTIDGVQYPGIVREIYNPSGQLVVSYFTPNSNSSIFQQGKNYSIGTGGPTGNGLPTGGVTGSTFFASPGNYGGGTVQGAGMTYTPSSADVLSSSLALTVGEKIFLLNRTDIVDEFSNYLTANGSTTKNKEFLKWAVGYLKVNSWVSLSIFRNQFLAPSEGPEGDFDENYWNTQTFPRQNLPSWNDFSANFPTKELYPDYTSLLPVLGGAVGALYVPGGEPVNTCAIRLSYALRQSGVTIPVLLAYTDANGVPHPAPTLKDRDGNNYFIRAGEINAWMRKTFGTNDGDPTTPSNSNHVKITLAEAGPGGTGLPFKVANKKGIYSLVSSNPIWASGHADMLKPDGSFGVFGHFYDAPIAWIDIWILQ